MRSMLAQFVKFCSARLYRVLYPVLLLAVVAASVHALDVGRIPREKGEYTTPEFVAWENSLDACERDLAQINVALRVLWGCVAILWIATIGCCIYAVRDWWKSCLVAAAIVVAASSSAPAHAQYVANAMFNVNRVRAQYGQPPLIERPDLQAFAYREAQTQMFHGRMGHYNGCGPGNEAGVGEGNNDPRGREFFACYHDVGSRWFGGGPYAGAAVATSSSGRSYYAIVFAGNRPGTGGHGGGGGGPRPVRRVIGRLFGRR